MAQTNCCVEYRAQLCNYLQSSCCIERCSQTTIRRSQLNWVMVSMLIWETLAKTTNMNYPDRTSETWNRNCSTNSDVVAALQQFNRTVTKVHHLISSTNTWVELQRDVLQTDSDWLLQTLDDSYLQTCCRVTAVSRVYLRSAVGGSSTLTCTVKPDTS